MPDCKVCKEKRREVEPVPFIVHESMKYTMERTVKRLWIVILVLIVLLCATNGVWIWYETQFEEVSVTQRVEQETDDGGNNSNTFVGGDYYGETESDNYRESSQEENGR